MRYNQIIQELQGVKKYAKLPYHEIIQALAPQGVRWLSNGKYGVVLDHPSWKYVIKLWEKDDCYLRFVDYAIAHPNKHFPKFTKKLVKLPMFYKNFGESDTVHAIRIEKLKPLSEDMGEFIVWFLIESDPMMDDYNKGGEALVQQKADERRKKHGAKWKGLDCPTPDGGTGTYFCLLEFWQKYPWLKDLTLVWDDLLYRTGACYPDLHAGNLMQRADGTIVITDPYWAGSSSSDEQSELASQSVTSWDDFGDDGDDFGHGYGRGSDY